MQSESIADPADMQESGQGGFPGPGSLEDDSSTLNVCAVAATVAEEEKQGVVEDVAAKGEENESKETKRYRKVEDANAGNNETSKQSDKDAHTDSVENSAANDEEPTYDKKEDGSNGEETEEASEERNIENEVDDDKESEEEENDNDNASVGTAVSRAQNVTTSKSRYAMPDYLDRSTINAIKSYLTDFDANAELDEDEIVQLMTKADRNVEHRARYYSNPLDDFVDEERMHKDFKKEEEEHLVGHDFMRTMSTSLNAKRRRALDKRTINWVKKAAGLNRKDYHTPHSALGRDDHDSDDPGGGGRSAPRRYTRGMAKTTRIKKQEEFVFKDNLGLKSLLDAIEELEPESGPYPVPFECARSRARPRENLRSKNGSRKKAALGEAMRGHISDDESIKERRTFDPGTMRPLIARITEEDSWKGQERSRNFIFGDNRDILVTKIMVGGKHVPEDEEDRMSLTVRKRELKRLRDRQYQKRRRDRKLAGKGQGKHMLQKGKFTAPRSSNTKRGSDYDSETDDDHRPGWKFGDPAESTVSRSFPASSSRKRPVRGPVNLPLLDWQRRQMWTPGKRAKRGRIREMYASLTVPEHLARSGIGYRLPPWESVNPASNISDQANHAEPPRNRHSDDVYASWCHKLVNCLNGGARGWAMKEFFYSDIDRPFYTANSFAKEVAKLGILPNAKMTRREWSVVRRMIRRRPRRFSKRFILSQLRERNKYRKMVRDLQQKPDETNHTGYAIPAPIRVGATVTAYNKKFLILHRGVILHHEPSNGTTNGNYLVQFERKELGHEMCSDTEVASHGVPDILMPAAQSRLSGTLHDYARLSDDGSLPYGTSFGPLSVAKTEEIATCEKELTSLLTGGHASSKPQTSSSEDAPRAALVEKVAERAALVALMLIIDTATARKAMLLDVMEKFSTLLVDRLPFGEGPPSNHVTSGYFESHFAWLVANLDTTNRTLQRAAGFLKVMYSKAYSPSRDSPGSTMTREEQIKKMFIETALTQERRLCGGPPSATLHWIAALHHGSNDVGDCLSSLVLQEDALPRDDMKGVVTIENPGEKFLRSRMAAAGSVLSVIGYCCGRSGESDITLPDGDTPLADVVMASSVANMPSPEVQHADMDDVVLKDALSERDAAAQELKDAFALLGKEFAGHSFASRARQQAAYNFQPSSEKGLTISCHQGTRSLN